MSSYEYRVVPAPKQPAKVPGLRDPEARYGHALEAAINAEARQGWEFRRVETLTAEVKRGWLSRARAEPVAVMIFRRGVDAGAAYPPATMIEDPAPSRPAATPRRGPEPVLRPHDPRGDAPR